MRPLARPGNGRSTAMCINYFTFFPGIRNDPQDPVGYFRIPRKGDRRAISLGGQGFSISSKIPARQQRLAKRFIQWFLKTENQEKWITKAAGFPSRRDAIQGPPPEYRSPYLASIGACLSANQAVLKSSAFLELAPYNRAFAESVDHLQDFWNLKEYSELLWASQRYLGEALDGRKTPTKALDRLTREHETIFRRAGYLKE